MAQIEHHLPTEVLAEDKSDYGAYRPGLSFTAADSGYSLTRIWSEMNLRRYSLNPIMLDASGNGLRNMKHFLAVTGMGTAPFWLKEQVTGHHFNLPCGPVGDASRTCFPVPFYGSITDGVYMIDGVPQASSGYTIHSSANLLQTDACAHWDTSIYAAYDSSISDLNNFGLVAPDSVAWTPDGLGSPAYTYISNAAKIIANGAPVTVGDSYTGILSFFETKTAARTNIKYTIRWYDSGGSYITMGAWKTVTLVTGQWVTDETIPLTAPASAAYGVLIINDGTNTATDPIYLAGASIAPSDYDRWHLPTMAPNVIEFSSAPALNKRITASGEGTGVARCTLARAVSEWSMISPGHATIKSIEANEEVEI